MINKGDIFSVETAVHDIEVIEQEFLCCRIFSKSSCPLPEKLTDPPLSHLNPFTPKCAK